MIAFADGAADVLVCTTIIESGLDIPTPTRSSSTGPTRLGWPQLLPALRGPRRAGRHGTSLPPAGDASACRTPRPAKSACEAIFNASGTGRRVPDRAVGPQRSAGNILGGLSCPATWRLGTSTSTRASWPGGPKITQGDDGGTSPDRRGSAGRRRPAGRGAFPRSGRRGRLLELFIDASPPEPARLATWRRSARRSSLDTARCPIWSFDLSRSPSSGWRPRRLASPRSRARRAGSSSVEAGFDCRATAMRLLAGPSLPGLRPNDVTFASNQVRLRLPPNARKGWTLTQAVVARLSATAA